MAEESWQQARLSPTSGNNGTEEAEPRATSALLAVMGSVREFGQSIVRTLGAPAGHRAPLSRCRSSRRNGRSTPTACCRRAAAQGHGTCLVEVKTGSSDLERVQIEAYLDVARANGFDGVLTISNQLAPAPGVHSVDVDKRKLRKVALHHSSWAEVLTIAVQQRVHRGVSVCPSGADDGSGAVRCAPVRDGINDTVRHARGSPDGPLGRCRDRCHRDHLVIPARVVAHR